MATDVSKPLASFSFGSVRVEPQRNRLVLADGQEAALEPKVMEVLCLLAERATEVVTREELLEGVWRQAYGGDESLTRAVSVLRKHLGASAIETIPKRGYRLTQAIVTEAAADPRGGADRAGGTSAAGSGATAGAGRVPGARTLRFPSSVWARVAAALGALLLVGLTWATASNLGGGASTDGPPGPQASDVRLAATPFATSILPEADAQRARGLNAELTLALGSAGRVGVIATPSTSVLAAGAGDPAAAAQAVGADWVLDGVFANDAANNLTLRLELYRVASDAVVWQEQVQAPAGQWLQLRSQLQTALRRGYAAAGLPAITLPPAPTSSEDAYQAFLAGNALMSDQTIAGFEASQAKFREAIALDPRLADAYSLLAITLLILPHETPGVAQPFISRALQLAPDAPRTRMAQAVLHRRLLEWDRFDDEVRKALDADPNFLPVQTLYLRSLVDRYRIADAEKLSRRLIVLDPLGRDTAELYIRTLTRRSKPQEAIAYADRVLVIHHNPGDIPFYRAVAKIELGDVVAGLEDFVSAYERLSPPRTPAGQGGAEFVRARTYLSQLVANIGDPDLASRVTPEQAMQRQHDAGRAVPDIASMNPAALRTLSPRLRAWMLILHHDLEAALPWLEETHRLGQSSNYAEHPDDYKAYLAMARRRAGDEAGAVAIAQEFAQDLKAQADKGDQSVLLLLPARILSAAASEDRDSMYALLAQAESRGSPLITLHEAIFDPYRTEPRFQRLEERFAALRARQLAEAESRGLIRRIEAVVEAQERLAPKTAALLIDP